MVKKQIEKYEPQKIEPKWQKRWQESKIYSPDLDKAEKPFYNLMMFPYPSAEGLHAGNMYAFTGADIYGRFTRMKGNDVFEPVGLDGFGIHSENYALKVGKHPKEQAEISEKNFYRQFHEIGNSFDWTRKLETYDSNYYKWTQWIFIQMFKKGLAYRKKAKVNYCPSCKTVLSDEQVIKKETDDGAVNVCERCSTNVEKKELEQWFFKITNYAEKLLSNLEKLNWSEKVKIAQKNWIGKKEGINIEYEIENEQAEKILKVICFTTRPDTNFGATFVVIGPEHKSIKEILIHVQDDKLKKEIKDYIEAAKRKTEVERIAEGRKKTGVFTGFYAINLLTGRKMPLWISDFVIGDVGTGAVVGVPGHDIRDFQFAQEFNLPIIRVVVGKDGDKSEITDAKQVQEEEGIMINSEFLNGLEIHEATRKIMDYMEERGWGKRVTAYHLRDWLISRQRYWGPPIPMIYCEKDGWSSVKEEDLPVLLPDVKDWRPEGIRSTSSGQAGKSPLANHPEFYKTTCPVCGGEATRETDVSDTFLDSSWYFFRYLSTEFDNEVFDKERVKKWLPVDMYIGGAEHSVLHLLYSRFVTMVFYDLGLIDFDEPFSRFYAHGLLIKEGAKMSKSKGNIVVPDVYIKKYGADTLRCYLMFLGPFSQGGDFSDAGIEGMNRFLRRIFVLFQKVKVEDKEKDPEVLRAISIAINGVTEDISKLFYNTSIAKLMEFYNAVSNKSVLGKDTLSSFLKLLAPFAPHITEELWEKMENEFSIHKQSWPLADKKHLEHEEALIVVQINGKIRDTIKVERLKMKDEKWVETKAKESEKVQKYLEGREVRKVVYVEGKIINFVVN
ncbi:MAG: leucine--tRNA ligase [Patescibacteria group bacterium]|nr:leucine--tRNA ligase [Patescibacteria group bacterium]